MTCPADLLEAARAVAVFLTMSTDPMTSDLMYRTPAMAMREAADELERKDAAIARFRAALDACGKKP